MFQLLKKLTIITSLFLVNHVSTTNANTRSSLPPLNIPYSRHSVRVRIIDTTSVVDGLPLSLFIEPQIQGFSTLSAPAYSFLIEYASSRKVLFDLGVRTDPQNLAPIMANTITAQNWTVKADEEVRQILEENGVQALSIEAIIWSRMYSPYHPPSRD